MILTLADIRFFLEGRELPHSSPFLTTADYVSITFQFQKNDERSDSVGMHRTDDPVICPVKAWAYTVRRILAYPDSSPSSQVNLFKPHGNKPTIIHLS